MSVSPEFQQFLMEFKSGQHSSSDPATIPKGSVAKAVNCVFTKKGYPTQCLGQQRYNATSIGAYAVRCGVGFQAEDDKDYMVVVCNTGLYYSTGNGTMTTVKYKGENTAVTVDATKTFRFQEFYWTTSGTQKKVVFMVSDDYPIATNSDGTQNQKCTVSRALMLYVDSSVVYAKNIFYDTTTALDTMFGSTFGTWTQGTSTPTLASDTTAGHGASLSGGIKMTDTDNGFIDFYKALSVVGTAKTVMLDCYADTLENVDYIFITLTDGSANWSRWTFASSGLTGAARTTATFDLTTAPAAKSATPCDLSAVTQVTIGVHTTASQAVNYTFSQLVFSPSGTDDQVVGRQSVIPAETPWPKNGKYICRIFDKLLVANYDSHENYYAVSQARDGLNWTNPTGAVDIGGGSIEEPYTMAYSFNTSVLLWTRNTLTVVNATPGDLSTWREQQINTTLGNVGNQVALNNDGWVYYISPQGIARTDGRIAELADIAISDQTSLLAILEGGSYSLKLDQSSDWKAGTIGINNVDVSGAELKQDVQDTQTDWLAGVVDGNIDLTAVPDAFQLLSSGGTNYALNAVPISNHTGADAPYPVSPLLATDADDSTAGTFGKLSSAPLGVTIPLSAEKVISHLTARFIATATPIGPCQVTVYGTLDGNIVWSKLYRTSGTSLDQTVDEHPNVEMDAVSFLMENIIAQKTLAIYYVKAFSEFPASGSLLTRTIDYGVAPTTFGDLVANVKVPAGCSVAWYGQSSADDSTYSALTPLGTTTGGAEGNATFPISVALARYLKIQATLVPDSTYTLTPTVYSIGVGGQWISATKDLTTTPTQWGTFEASQENTGVIYEFSGSSNGSSWDAWEVLEDGEVPGSTLRRYVRFRVSLTSQDYIRMPLVYSIGVSYLLGASANVSPSLFCHKSNVYVSFMKNNSLVNANDTVYVGETRPVPELLWEPSPLSGTAYPIWSQRDFMRVNWFFVFANNLYGCDSLDGFVDTLETGRTNCAYIIDDFERPESATTLGNSTTGQTWAYGTVGGAGDTDIFGITARTAYCVNANQYDHARYATIDSSLADCNVVVTMPVLNPNQGMIVRFIDANNYIALYCTNSTVDPTKKEWVLRKHVSGSDTDSSLMPAADSIGYAEDGDQLQVNLHGTAVKVFVNGSLRYSTTTANTTGTKHGMYLAGVGSVSSTWEDFSISFWNISSPNYTTIIETPALTGNDADLILRYFYLYYQANSDFETVFRTRKGVSGWTEWSDILPTPRTLSFEGSQNITRSVKKVLPGLVEGTAVQLKVRTSLPDSLWAVPRMAVYYRPRAVGR